MLLFGDDFQFVQSCGHKALHHYGKVTGQRAEDGRETNWVQSRTLESQTNKPETGTLPTGFLSRPRSSSHVCVCGGGASLSLSGAYFFSWKAELFVFTVHSSLLKLSPHNNRFSQDLSFKARKLALKNYALDKSDIYMCL